MQRTSRSSRSTEPRSSDDGLADAQARAVEQLDERRVSERPRRRARRGFHQPLRLRRVRASSAAGESGVGTGPPRPGCRSARRSAARAGRTTAGRPAGERVVDPARPAARSSARYCSISRREADPSIPARPRLEVLEVAPVALDRPRRKPRARDCEEPVDGAARHVPSVSRLHPQRPASTRRPCPEARRDEEQDPPGARRRRRWRRPTSSQKRSG